MADISMCQGGVCPIKEKCYRFTATPSMVWQAYIMGDLFFESLFIADECSMFVDNREYCV